MTAMPAISPGSSMPCCARSRREGAANLAGLDAPRLNTPDWLWRRWQTSYGEAIARASPRRISRAAARSFGEERCRRNGRTSTACCCRPERSGLKDDRRDRALAGFGEGAWWVQDAARRLPVLLFGDVAGKRVLDLCAAPGGKTAQLAARAPR